MPGRFIKSVGHGARGLGAKHLPQTPSPMPYAPLMSEKKGFLLRLNPEMLVELERWAQDEFRSVNGQIEYLLNDALKKRRRAQKIADNEASKSGNDPETMP